MVKFVEIFNQSAAAWRNFGAACVLGLSLGLVGCGGANGDVFTDTATSTGTTPSAASASLKILLTDNSGAVINQVSPVDPGTLQAQVKDANGTVVPNVAVTFTTSDKTGVFVPSSGTALTDISGVAKVTLPAGAQAGAFTATASALLGSTAVKASTSYGVGFPILTLGALALAPTTLSAGGTASLSTTVLSGGNPFTPAQSVSFTSPCAVAGKAVISSPVITVNGVASTSYTDKGCGGSDTITASTSLADATASRSGTLAILPATAGQISFVSALPQNIALKGTGGPGRQESSTVTFKVLDRNGNPVAGVLVDFFAFSSTGTSVGTGGLTLNPIVASSGADGMVATVVLAGTVNTPVRISATLSGTVPAITSISDQLVVSTGIPDQDSFSLSTETYNVEGASYDGCPSPFGSVLRISLADHFNNPVPDGTAVSFTAEGAVVDASCLTGLTNTTLTNGTVIAQKGIPGVCTVRFCSASPRPRDGRITILAYALGEESFTDDPAIANSINRFDPAETFQDLCEPFRNDRAISNSEANSTVIDAKAGRVCEKPVVGEPYIDTNGDGQYTATGDGKYNGVLNIDPATGQTIASAKTPVVHVRASLVQVLSTSVAAITSLTPTTVNLDHCVNGTPFVNNPRTVFLAIRDLNPTVFPGNTLPGNILPAGTQISITASNAKILGEASFVVPNTNEHRSAVWTYPVSVQSDATQSGPGATPPLECTNPVSSGALTVKVTTPGGTVTSLAVVAIND